MIRKAWARLTAGVRSTRSNRAFRPNGLENLEGREVPAAVLPTGFEESVVTAALSNPVALTAAPDGRVFVADAGGAIRVIQNGQLLPQPFEDLSVDKNSAQGLTAITLDPKFEVNHYVYVVDLVPSGLDVDAMQVLRFTAAGNVAKPGSEKVLLTLPGVPAPLDAAVHVGAAIHFGGDGKLYISTGDLSTGSVSQSLDSPFGKILRINANGTIPTNNPFYKKTKGVDRAIWALGLRNPYTFAFQPGTGLMFINDVGESTWESIDRGVAGADYGWPIVEGPVFNSGFTPPIYVYAHATQPNPNEVAISGGAFYDPAKSTFPASYVGLYFFEDFGNGWIDTLNPKTGAVSTFASGLTPGMNDMTIGANGTLYFLNYSAGTLNQIVYKG